MTIMDHFTFSRAPVDTSKKTEIGVLKQVIRYCSMTHPMITWYCDCSLQSCMLLVSGSCMNI